MDAVAAAVRRRGQREGANLNVDGEGYVKGGAVVVFGGLVNMREVRPNAERSS